MRLLKKKNDIHFLWTLLKTHERDPRNLYINTGCMEHTIVMPGGYFILADSNKHGYSVELAGVQTAQ